MLLYLRLNIPRPAKTTLVLASLMLLFLLFKPSVSALAAAGDLDPTFGNGGKLFLPANDTSPQNLWDMDIQPDGKIVATGGVQFGPFFSPSWRGGLVRLNPNGTFDTGFGNNGRVVPPLQPYHARRWCSVALQTDGKIVLACRSQLSTTQGIGIWRYNSDGTPDLSFDTDGAAFTAVQSNSLETLDVVIQPDGKILVGAYFNFQISRSRFLLARYNPNGSLDASFGSGGLALSPPQAQRDDYLSKVLLLPNGKIVAAGGTSPNDFFLFFGFNPDGTLDTSFGTNGEVKTQLGNFSHYVVGAVLQPDGKIIFVGATNNPAYTYVILRYNPNGAIDTTFGTNGNGISVLQLPQNAGFGTLTMQADGKFVIAGRLVTSSTTSSVMVARITAVGVLDASFGTNGFVTTGDFGLPGTNSAWRVAIQPDGKIVVVGDNHSDKLTHNPILARYLAAGAPDLDFDGDDKADVSIFRPDASAAWYWLNSSNNQSSGQQFGIATDKIVPADYDGDAKTDIAVFRDGDWYRLNSSNNQFVAVHFGQTGDLPVPADYDGDARDDLAVYRQGNWYILNSSNNSFRTDQFGISTDKPIIGDFDGDGKTDLAVYRDGIWYQMRSQQGFYAEQFGVGSDKPVTADYDGDGKTDLAVYRPSDGVWYLLQTQLGFTALQFGVSTDKPVPADYDGDGKADIAVYRDGNWYVQQSSQGFRAVQFGASTDIPVPNAFVP
ncbi:MAG TPA: FG-GAP-like repeat-containing protein [Pyrinomonadaceae bacterium]|jgi:uncharacterized delta-60 repeat protein